MDSPTKLLKLEEAASRLGISKRTVERMVEQGDLAVIRFGRSVRIRSSLIQSLEEVLKGDVFAKETKGQGNGTVYVLLSAGFVKIGITRRPVKDRLADLQTGNPIVIRCIGTVPTKHPERVEQMVHQILKEKGMHESGEWFRCSPQVAREVLYAAKIAVSRKTRTR